jgi:hypothetical protein
MAKILAKKSIRHWTDCFGTETYASGDKYVGEFKDNNPNGQGTYTFTNGENLSDTFRHWRSR